MSQALKIGTNAFFYNGTNYRLGIMLSCPDAKPNDTIWLFSDNIMDFEVSISLNRLFVDGFIIYKDDAGAIATMLDMYDVSCLVDFSEYSVDSNTGGIGDGVFGTETPKKDQEFKHVFIVENIEIIKNDNTSITYMIHLIGAEYQNLMRNVVYTNYKTDKQSVMELVQHVLSDVGGLKTDSSFNEAIGGNGIHYISQLNDNVLTTVEFLLQKQFFGRDLQDSIMKFLVYDAITDTFKMKSIGKEGKSTEELVSFIPISMDNNDSMEALTQTDKTVLASTASTSKSKILKKISSMSCWQFSLESNDFNVQTTTSQNIINFFTGGIDKKNRLRNLDKQPITRDVMEWDNDSNIYKDFVEIFTGWDSIIVNTGGIINRPLLSTAVVSILQRDDKSTGDTTKDIEESLGRYGQLNGPWFITKIRYIIKPAQSSFRQNLQLSRIMNMVGDK